MNTRKAMGRTIKAMARKEKAINRRGMINKGKGRERKGNVGASFTCGKLDHMEQCGQPSPVRSVQFPKKDRCIGAYPIA